MARRYNRRFIRRSRAWREGDPSPSRIPVRLRPDSAYQPLNDLDWNATEAHLDMAEQGSSTSNFLKLCLQRLRELDYDQVAFFSGQGVQPGPKQQFEDDGLVETDEVVTDLAMKDYLKTTSWG